MKLKQLDQLPDAESRPETKFQMGLEDVMLTGPDVPMAHPAELGLLAFGGNRSDPVGGERPRDLLAGPRPRILWKAIRFNPVAEDIPPGERVLNQAEAMRMGGPAVCSNGSSLPEVAGDAAQLTRYDIARSPGLPGIRLRPARAAGCRRTRTLRRLHPGGVSAQDRRSVHFTGEGGRGMTRRVTSPCGTARLAGGMNV